ncbi:polysaccharide deacetylase family protein [Risungbinella massiliensis]|uniref:polysaccharide deacetylase family protein n=1 Tax=Risungbinella massiliensis TaxID=1329796 RepID=UPI0005CC3885|nr:polysaccharide deacetylase family protein [Risungbinella massiliensis]
MSRPKYQMVATVICALLGVLLLQFPPLDVFIESVKKQQELSVSLFLDPNEQILEQIKSESEKRKKAPVDARVDRVWKAIPGYNGREVDVEATYKATLSNPQKKLTWRYREIAPKMNLKDLGAYPIYRGFEEKKAASIMINVAWGTEFLPKMLDILDQEQVKATFFLDGSWLKKNPDMAKQLVVRGHEIGNHAYSHPLMSQISQERIESEIGKTKQLIKETLQLENIWFAPPAGDFNQTVVDNAWKQGMHTVLWTLDTVDWRKSTTPESMVQKISSKLEPGSLILMHPTDRSVVALPQIIQEIKKKGLKPMPVGELLSPNRVDID